MAEDLNAVSLVGRLTRDAELSYTRNETPLLRFGLAVNRRRRDGDNWVDEASFFDMVYWGGRRAEALHRYLQKGQQIAVTGQLRQDRWEQDGQRRSRILVEVTGLQLLGGRSDSASGRRADGPDARFEPPPMRESRQGQGAKRDFPVTPATPETGTHETQPDDAAIRDFEDDVPF